MEKSKRIEKDNRILEKFISIYCKQNHIKKNVEIYRDGLCKECYELLQYSTKMNKNCPLDPKPQCKHCKVHCYKPDMRKKIKDVMKFSGLYLIKHGRLDWIIHYLL